MLRIDSSSVGDPALFRSERTLLDGLQSLAPAPLHSGRLVRVIVRGPAGRREPQLAAELHPEDGLLGDAWGRKTERDVLTQVTAMQWDLAQLVAGAQPVELFGDNLFIDLDLSEANLPCGSRLGIGEAVLDVTPEPHNGCRKFQARFGLDALRFTASRALRPKRLRGIHLRVIEGGLVRLGDSVVVLYRPGIQVEPAKDSDSPEGT